MLHECNMWVLGGDLRQARLAELLAEDGHRVYAYGLERAVHATEDLSVREDLEGIGRADCVIFPLPAADASGMLHCPLSSQRVQVTHILQKLSPSQAILGGRVDKATAGAAAELGLTIEDYLSREELAVANAVPTAEGTIQIAMEEMPITIHGARVLILGFGRVGRALAPRLQALGARVTVAARRYEAMAWAESMGLGAERLDDLGAWLWGCDLVVNTIPALVLGERELTLIRQDCLILDLASKPGGVDYPAAERLGRRVVWALSLPGKTAPASAGAAIRDTVYHMLEERGL